MNGDWSEYLQSKYPRVVLSEEQIKKRVQEMARQISSDFKGKTIHVVGVMENGFIFMADLVRELDLKVVCQFVRAESKEANPSTTEVFFSPELDVKGQHVLLVEALVQSGVTSEFLIRNLMGRGSGQRETGCPSGQAIGTPGVLATRLLWFSHE